MRSSLIHHGVRRPPGGSVVGGLVFMGFVSCTGGSETIRGPANPELARVAEEVTAPAAATRTVFDWNLEEGEARFRGEGVARIAPLYRARLDLFGPRGESYLRAVLIDRTLELPPGIAGAPLPPPGLLWSVLGVFREPSGAQLQATETRGDTVDLLYTRVDERWSFRLVDDLLRFAEWRAAGNRQRTVEIREIGDSGRPAVVVYRDWSAFRELTIAAEETEAVASFPAETWEVEDF